MTSLDLAALAQLAAAATPGPWKLRPDRYDSWGFVRAADGYLVANTDVGGRRGIAEPPNCHAYGQDDRGHNASPPQIQANGEFIAAASPEVVRELIGRAQKAEARIDKALSACDNWVFPTDLRQVAAILRGEQETT